MPAPRWWQDAICYQIYPRSFADSNGDGIGDVPGLIARLDYLKWLGVTALWISPFYPSAQIDWGYDVSDYIGVHPDYGTLAEVERLIAEAHRRGLRILLDLVLNHTSDQHAWFQASKSSRANPYREWYVWRAGRADGPPNDWESIFGGPAWTLDEATGQYYYHFFFAEQPDLNWRNPAVKAALFDVMRFWLDRGVDGFRLDAIGSLFEAEDLRDSRTGGSLEEMFINARRGVFDDWETMRAKIRHQMNQPEIHPLLQEMRALVDEYGDRVLLGESDDIALYGAGADELHSVFNFALIEKLEADYQRQVLLKRRAQLPAGAWDCHTVGNHDRRRSYSFYSDGEHDELRARLALALVMFLPGTPVFYYGEEIGMRQSAPRRLEQMKDTFGTRFYHILRSRYGFEHAEALHIGAEVMGRDGCRTPMQWRNAPHAGFTLPAAEPWLPVNPNYAEGVNVDDQRAEPGSTLHYFRALAQVRQAHPALQRGTLRLLEDTGPVLAFWREHQSEHLLVVLNMSAEARTLALPAPVRVVSASPPAQQAALTLHLPPYGLCLSQA